jgi:Fungal specific transcription factor domain
MFSLLLWSGSPSLLALHRLISRMHSYMQYYLDNVLPILHPFGEQMALLKDSLLSQLNRSPLVLYATLSVASLQVDDYCNRNDEHLFYSQWSNSELLAPHSCWSKAKTVHLLFRAMEASAAEQVSL